jgi:hypothetical protein
MGPGLIPHERCNSYPLLLLMQNNPQALKAKEDQKELENYTINFFRVLYYYLHTGIRPEEILKIA